MNQLHGIHSRPCVYAAFLASIALGGFACLQKHSDTAAEEKRRSPQVVIMARSPDPVEQSLGAVLEYRRARAARACGHCREAHRIFAGLSKSPKLNAAQREFCRNAMRRDSSGSE